MAVITGTQISDRLGILLNDTSLTRWPSSERLIWINDGRREMARLRPEVFADSTEATHTTTTGNMQTCTVTGAYRVVSVDSNVTSGRAIRQISNIDQLDAFRSGWRSDTGTDVENWATDRTNPLAFWVYPKVTAGAQLKIHVNISPADLGNISSVALQHDLYEPALVNYCMYRAYLKDDEVGAAEKAVAFYKLFTEGLA